MPQPRLSLRVLCMVALCAMLVACEVRTASEMTEAGEGLVAQGNELEEQALPTPISSGALEIIRPDGSVMWLTLAALQKMPAVTAMIQGKTEAGPALLVILQTARVGEFARVSVIGRSTNTLTRDQVTPDTILVFTEQGTVRLAAPHVPRESWAQDVATIKAE